MNENTFDERYQLNKTYTIQRKSGIPLKSQHINKYDDDSLENIKTEPFSYHETLSIPCHNITRDVKFTLKRELSLSQFVFSPPKKFAIETRNWSTPLALSTPKPLPILSRIPIEVSLCNWANDLLGYNQTNILDAQWNDIRLSAFVFFKNNKEMQEMTTKIIDLIDRSKLMIRKDRNLHTDNSLQKVITDLLLNYNRIWFKLGLEIVFGLKTNQNIEIKMTAFSKFLVDNLYRKPKSRSSLYLASYEAEVKKYTLKKLLILIFFLDRLKLSHTLQYDGCLFHSRSEIKESRQILLSIARELLKGVGDITKEINQMIGYVLFYKQDFLDEYNYQIAKFPDDLRNGVTLMRLVEKLRYVSAIRKEFNWKQLLRFPPISRLQKIHNIQMVLEISDLRECIDVNSVCDGNVAEVIKLMQSLKQLHDRPKYKDCVRCIENWWRSNNVQQNILKRHYCATIIQKNWKMYTVRKKYQQLKYSVIIIQRRFRNYRQVIKNRHDFLKKKRTVILIQKWYRNLVNAQNERLSYNRLKHLTICVQRRFRANQQMKIARAKFVRIQQAAITLQKHYRARIVMKKYRKIFLQQKSAAVKIQAIFRSYSIRKRYKKLRLCTIHIQRKFRAKLLTRKQLSQYTTLRKYAIIIQQRFRLKLKMRHDRAIFLQIRAVTVHLQALIRGLLVRKHVKLLRQAVRFIEEKYSAKIAMRKQLANYHKYCSCVILIQNMFRNKLKARQERNQFLSIKQNVITIQKYTRGYLVRRRIEKLKKAVTFVQAKINVKKHRQQFNQLRKSAILIQQKYRAKLQMRIDRVRFLTIKSSVILMQAYYRGLIVRRTYNLLRKSAIIIQRKLRATLLMHKERRNFVQYRNAVIATQVRFRAMLEMRKEKIKFRKIIQSAIKIQINVRCWLIRRQFITLRNATIFVQRKYRSKLLMRQQMAYYNRLRLITIRVQERFRAKLRMQRWRAFRQSIILIQAFSKGLLARKWFNNYRKTIIAIQQRFRANREMKKCRRSFCELKKCTILVQKIYRRNLAVKHDRALFLRKRSAAIMIQKVYRAYRVRKKMKVVIRKLKSKAANNVNVQMLSKLQHDFSCLTNYDFFSKYSTLMESEKMAQFLVFISRMAPHRLDCEEYIVENGFAVFESVNRSFGHRAVTLSWCEIVLNLLKFKGCKSHVFIINNYMDTLLQILNSSISHQTYDIFVRVCTIIWLCLKLDNAQILLHDPQVVKRLEKVQELFCRKYKINEKLHKNNCPMKMSEITLKSFSMPNIYPDFSVPSSKKPYIFQNGLHAILSVVHFCSVSN